MEWSFMYAWPLSLHQLQYGNGCRRNIVDLFLAPSTRLLLPTLCCCCCCCWPCGKNGVKVCESWSVGPCPTCAVIGSKTKHVHTALHYLQEHGAQFKVFYCKRHPREKSSTVQHDLDLSECGHRLYWTYVYSYRRFSRTLAIIIAPLPMLTQTY